MAVTRPRRIAVCSGFTADAITAHALNVTKMAEGFAELGHEVLLICRSDKDGTVSAEEMLGRYGIDLPVQVRMVPWTAGNHWKFCFHSMRHLLPFRPDFVYSRSYILPWLTSCLGVPTAGESHAHVGNTDPRFLRFMNAGKRAGFRSLVTISPVLSEYYINCGMVPDKIQILPDGVDLKRFRAPENERESHFGPGQHVVYTGHLYDYKGIPTVLEAAALLPDVTFHLVGGYEEDIERHRGRAEERSLRNVVFHGHVDHDRVPSYLWDADALLLPPSADHPSARWTSPMKLGEYMAAKKPIVASDIPALRHWLSNDLALYFTPDDAASMAHAIRQSLASKDTLVPMIDKAYREATAWSFRERARRILDFSLNGHQAHALPEELPAEEAR